MSITPLRFTGVSQFSEDLQAILNRAVAIAALPVQQLQNQQTDLLSKKQALTTLNVSVTALADAVAGLGRIGANKALTVTTSNGNRVSVSNNGLTAPATYTITEITSIAKAASETTAVGYADPTSTVVDADGVLELAFAGQVYEIDLSSGGATLNAIRDAVNGLGIGLTATVLNTGSDTDPYFLSLTATTPGETTLELRETAGDGGSNILTTTNQGANAVFKLNGLDVEKSDNVIGGVIPNLTFTILSTTEVDETVTLTAQSNRGTLSTALTQFVSAYNAAREGISAHIGENAGLLSGDFVIHQISRTLRQVTGYTGAGDLRSLVDLGVELSSTGVASFNSVKFFSLPTEVVNNAYEFLGSETTGLGALAGSLRSISDPITGFIRLEQNSFDATDLRLSKQIDALSGRIDQMQLSLQSKLQQADALLAALASQQEILQSSFDSVHLALFGRSDG